MNIYHHESSKSEAATSIKNICNSTGDFTVVKMFNKSTSSSDGEPEDTFQLLPRPRVIRDRANPFETYDDIEFKAKFRLQKETVVNILHMIIDQIEPATCRNKSVTAMNQMLITLRFYATGCFQHEIADTFHVEKATVSRIVKKVSRHIASLKDVTIKMPQTPEQCRQEASKFFGLSGFPGVIGVLACSHVKIQSPGGPNAEIFRNGKGDFSINVQAVCDATLKIRSIVARWPGSVCDSKIFNDSSLKVDLETGVYEDYYLLGDNTYSCKPFLLTPFLDPVTESEKAYNTAHTVTRKAIDRCFSQIKTRFASLSQGLRVMLETSLIIIVACCVLHNIAIINNEEEEEVEPLAEPPGDVDGPKINESENADTSVRRMLVNTTFYS